jgi:hypothetical protein
MCIGKGLYDAAKGFLRDSPGDFGFAIVELLGCGLTIAQQIEKGDNQGGGQNQVDPAENWHEVPGHWDYNPKGPNDTIEA